MEAAIDRIMQTYDMLANRTAAAISGSAWSSEAVKNESGAEAVFAEVILRISPPPQAFWRATGGSGVTIGSERDLPHHPPPAK